MNVMETLGELKNLVNQMVELELQACNMAGIDSSRSELITEYQAMAIYVSGADNDISENEIALFNFLFDMDLSARDMGGLIQTLSGLYENLMIKLQLPGWAVLKAMDEAMGTQSSTTMYMNVVEQLMQFFAAVDGNSDPQEERFIQDFIGRLNRDR